MQKISISAVVLGLLSACTSPYGNYTTISEAYNAQMADDAAQELSELYPPATTHLMVSQPTPDAYGVELVKKLREYGYAIENGADVNSPVSTTDVFREVSSSKPDLSKNHTDAKPSVSVPVIKTAGADNVQAGNRSIFYIVDQIEAGLYRVTIRIDSKVLSRVYRGSSKGILPAGSWTRKE